MDQVKKLAWNKNTIVEKVSATGVFNSSYSCERSRIWCHIRTFSSFLNVSHTSSRKNQPLWADVFLTPRSCIIHDASNLITNFLNSMHFRFIEVYATLWPDEGIYLFLVADSEYVPEYRKRTSSSHSSLYVNGRFSLTDRFSVNVGCCNFPYSKPLQHSRWSIEIIVLLKFSAMESISLLAFFKFSIFIFLKAFVTNGELSRISFLSWNMSSPEQIVWRFSYVDLIATSPVVFVVKENATTKMCDAIMETASHSSLYEMKEILVRGHPEAILVKLHTSTFQNTVKLIFIHWTANCFPFKRVRGSLCQRFFRIQQRPFQEMNGETIRHPF